MIPETKPTASALRREVSQHVKAIREAKRVEAEAVGISAAYISDFVDRFYRHIREDALLGPIFAERIADWDHHLARMKAFWRSVLHNSGEFSGNPMAKHIAIPGLERRHFEQWLTLFYRTLEDKQPSCEATQQVATRARMIADSLLTGIEIKRHGLKGANAGKELPYV